MKSISIFGDLFQVQELAPTETFTRKTLLLLGMYAVLTMCTYGLVTAVVTNQRIPTCSAEQVLIRYPVYDSYGIESGHELGCGIARKSCTQVSDTLSGKLYECPGSMRPSRS